jgi:hypothetical protein
MMSNYQLSDSEKDLLKVIKNEIDYAKNVPSLDDTKKALDISILESESLLRANGHMHGFEQALARNEGRTIKLAAKRSFDELLKDANRNYPDDICFEDIFTNAEMVANAEHILMLNAEFAAIHKLDAVDIIIPAVAGILSGAVDCVFGGFVTDQIGRAVPGTMTEFVNKMFDKALPAERIKKLEELAKVPYDALNYDNRGNVIVNEIVDGLSPIFHHEVSLGHDPILGFIFGVLDMMRGTVTTLDFKGKFLIQAAEGFSDRKAQGIFQAIATVFLHMLSDVNGSSSAKNGGMGLPAPFMALFNKLQFGKVGDSDTIAELVKSMFYQGYDFRHFCAMSIPAMITEVIVRVSYFAKRMHDGYSFAEAIPLGTNHVKKPKLGTILFIAHFASTAINAGKVVFTDNPLNINYPQWMAFARYSTRQLKWILREKPVLRDSYVLAAIDDEWACLTSNIDSLWDECFCDVTTAYV